MIREHNVAIRVGASVIEHWQDYSFTLDMLQPADNFRMSLPGAGKDVWDLVKPDAEVQILLDDTVMITGFIDDRRRTGAKDGTSIEVTGRDKGGRLIDESMPLGSIHGLRIKPFAEKCVQPWFTSVTISNARNRRNLRGKGQDLAKVAREPLGNDFTADERRETHTFVQQSKDEVAIANALTTLKTHGAMTPDEKLKLVQISKSANKMAAEQATFALSVPSGTVGSNTKVNPGESRWQVLANFLADTGLLAWSSGDGKEFFVGLPNYAQDAQYYFFAPKPHSDRLQDGNVLDWEIQESVAERYSRVICYGTGKGDENNDHSKLHFRAQVSDGPAVEGTGNDFQHGKILIIHDSKVRTRGDSDERAKLEMGERDATGHRLSMTVQGHAFSWDNGRTKVNYAPDTIAIFEDEEIELKGRYLITAATFSDSREGEHTKLSLVPHGTVLKI